ncbi:hypothetical protein GBA52_011366 [Prunus armeniaca]|nr:hypothetical protein GBA52_011366 [Prunus armeniaca]
METKAAKKRRLIEEENERNGRGRDRFSDLPNEISNHIFSFLPMKSIAQVSFTSKRWRSLWDSFPILDFSEVCPFTSQVFQKKSFGQIFYHQMSAMRSATSNKFRTRTWVFVFSCERCGRSLLASNFVP